MPCQLITTTGRIVDFTTDDAATHDLKVDCRHAHKYVRDRMGGVTKPGSYQLTRCDDERFDLNDPRIDLICA